MPAKNQPARDRLTAVLARQAAVSAADLASRLRISLPTLHRLLHERPEAILTVGKARRTRYALRRPLRGDPRGLPLYAIDECGTIQLISELFPIYPQGTWMPLADTDWPLTGPAQDGWWDGLPYPLYDMRPQGYMGRQLARAVHGELDVPDHPGIWNDDEILWILSRTGADVSGNLILGDPAAERWQQTRLEPLSPLAEPVIAEAYAVLAEQALASGIPGSSAAGEFPKFTTQRALPGSATSHVLVKFSGADASPAVTRWADLLICEHLALECARLLPEVASAASRLLFCRGRTFLEVERFDRHGDYGRSPLCSLETLEAELLGTGLTEWPRVAEALATAGLLSAADLAPVERLWWYGRLIANTDMHLGNLSFRPERGRLRLAPAYDLLPMLYAPLPGGELPVRDFTPPLPPPSQWPLWQTAAQAALSFWARAAAEPRLSPPFRARCALNGQQLRDLAEKAAGSITSLRLDHPHPAAKR